MQEDDQVRLLAHEMWLEDGSSDGKHDLHRNLASRSTKRVVEAAIL